MIVSQTLHLGVGHTESLSLPISPTTEHFEKWTLGDEKLEVSLVDSAKERDVVPNPRIPRAPRVERKGRFDVTYGPFWRGRLEFHVLRKPGACCKKVALYRPVLPYPWCT